MPKQLLRLLNWFVLAATGSPDQCNRLATPGEIGATRKPARRLLVLVLLVTCFVPRALTAWRLDGICADGASYIHMAQALERGDFGQAFRLQLNIYPAILAGLHQLGIPWELCGRVWGTLVATLVVLPLFGWVRRQFDDRLAIIACLLYAGHPELIEWSPETVRDPTFWLFFTTSIYLLWRAAAEVSLKHYAAAGLAITFASLTRFEGLFLCVPLLGWTLARAWASRALRPRLIAGVALSLAVLPSLLVAGNVAWSSRTGRVEMIRLEKLNVARNWIVAWWNPPKVAVPAMAHAGIHNREAQPGGAVHWGTGRLLWQFVHQGERGLTPLFAILLFTGCLAHPRLLFRGDQWPMAVLSLLICAGIWAHTWYFHLSSGRYFLPIAILSTPTAALGWMCVARGLRRVIAARHLSRIAWRLAPAAIMAALLVIGWTDALTTNVELRLMNIRLGRWIGGHCGRQPTILGIDDQLPVVAHYAHGNFIALPAGLSDHDLVDMVRKQRPDVVVFSRRHLTGEYSVVMGARRELGLEPVDNLPDVSSRFVVLARNRLER
jgi:hypothetical protein